MEIKRIKLNERRIAFMDNLNTFGKRLKYIRKTKGLTQRELANAIGLDQSAISHFERDKKKPDMDTLKTIADMLNISIDFLLTRTNDPVTYSRNQTDLIKKVNNNPYITAEELTKNYRFIIDGREATQAEIEEAIKYILIQRMMKKRE